MDLGLRVGWRPGAGATHPEGRVLRELAVFLLRFVYFAYLWLLAFALVPLLWGWRPVVIDSGSMEPVIGVGDVVVARPHDGSILAPGSVITFTANGRLVTHRIAEVLPDGSYVTVGDANGGTDSSPVAPGSIEGEGRMLIPYVGLPVVWIGSGHWYPIAWFGAMLIGLGLWLWARKGRKINWPRMRPPSIEKRLPTLELPLESSGPSAADIELADENERRPESGEWHLRPEPERVGRDAEGRSEPGEAGSEEAADPFDRISLDHVFR